MTVETVVETMAGHDLDHAQQLKEIVESQRVSLGDPGVAVRYFKGDGRSVPRNSTAQYRLLDEGRPGFVLSQDGHAGG